MPSLLGETISYTCERCGSPFSFEIWSVVDTVERPDLAGRITDASIRVFACPSCGETVSSIDPLLVYRPHEGGLGAMILATSSPDEEAVQGTGGLLARWVAHEIGADPREIGTIVTHWELLPAVMQRNVARDLETPDALLDLSPELGAWYRHILGQLRADHGLSWVTDLGDGDLPEVELVEHVAISACPECGKASTATVPRTVTDRPGLGGLLRAGDFYTHVCPHCRARLPSASSSWCGGPGGLHESSLVWCGACQRTVCSSRWQLASRPCSASSVQSSARSGTSRWLSSRMTI